MSLSLVVVGVTIVGLSGRLVELRAVKESSQGGTETINLLIGNPPPLMDPSSQLIYPTSGIFFILCAQILCVVSSSLSISSEVTSAPQFNS
jgi:hypothetical protein